uniref:Uncharacterized protein n=1 Tax=Cacopsylla melanoneura TaxID=428564 RepID=A0A8D8Y3N5_9HEMI
MVAPRQRDVSSVGNVASQVLTWWCICRCAVGRWPMERNRRVQTVKRDSLDISKIRRMTAKKKLEKKSKTCEQLHDVFLSGTTSPVRPPLLKILRLPTKTRPFTRPTPLLVAPLIVQKTRGGVASPLVSPVCWDSKPRLDMGLSPARQNQDLMDTSTRIRCL